jgi:hypothetical protein
VRKIGPYIGFIGAAVLLISVVCCFRRRKILLKELENQFVEEKENDSYHLLDNKKGTSYGIDKETLAITRMKTKDKPALDKALGLLNDDESQETF